MPASASIIAAQELTKQQVTDLCIRSGALAEENYVLAEKKKPIGAFIAERCRSAEYAKITTRAELIQILTADLQKASGGDKHLYIQHSGELNGTKARFDPAVWERKAIEKEKLTNFGLTEIQILNPSVGYLKIEQFMNPDRSIQTLSAAMKFLETTDAMIIDLRGNPGGSGALCEYLIANFFPDEPTLLSTTLFADKNKAPENTYVQPYVFGKRQIGKPIYILIDRVTGSAAEYVAYTMQAFKKAVIVGEPSGGAAHMNSFFDLGDGFRISVSTAAPINSITKSNWEGKGVQPDIVCDPRQAKEEALKDYRKKQDSPLSKTVSGRRVLDFFSAVNSGDKEKFKNFILENYATNALKESPVERIMEIQSKLQKDFQEIEIREIVSMSETEIKLLVQGKTGLRAELTFEFEKNAPNKILGLRVMLFRATPSEKQNGQIKPPANQADFLPTVEKYLADQTAADKFSGVVLIAENDKPTFVRAYGLANKENKTSNNTDTKFNLGSINKIFTRIAIGQLIKAGKISLDDKLGKYLPDYPNKDAGEKVTIRHLVTMKSGIGDFFGEKFMAMPKDKLRTNGDYIPLFAEQPLAFEPGTNQGYSNGGYILLGAIIEKVTGKSYYDYVRENIFNVAGMKNTDSYESDKLPANTAFGYTNQNPKNEWVNNRSFHGFRGSAAGGGYSNAEDLLKFSAAVKSGKLIDLGDDGQPLKADDIRVAGGSVGINSMLTVNGRNGLTIIVLSNYDPPSAENAESQIRAWASQIKK